MEICNQNLVVLVALFQFSLVLGNNNNSCTFSNDLCFPPESISGVALATEEQAAISARCFASCVEENIQSIRNRNVNVTGTESLWRNVGFSSLSCSVYSLVLACQQGCIIMFGNQALGVEQCQGLCVDVCNTKKDSTNSECVPSCSGGSCSRGCILANNADTQTSTANAPTLQPDLVKDTLRNRTGDGQYLVSYLPPATQSNNADREQITSFVFRIEGNDTTYIHLAGFDDILDLTSLSCQRVNITFAVVTSELNPFQPLGFSPVLQFCIDGDKINPRLNIDVGITHIVEDFRPQVREQRRAVITIVWLTNPNVTRLLSGFAINLTNGRVPSCGASPVRSYNVEKSSGWINSLGQYELIVSATDPTDLPTFGNDSRGCNYNIVIQALPLSLGFQPISKHLYRLIKVSSAKPFFRAVCSVEYDLATGLISPSIQWTVDPPDLGFLISESLGKLTIFYNEAFLDEAFRYTRGDPISSPNIRAVGNFTISSRSFTGVISLEENGSGVMTLHNVQPKFNPNAIQFNMEYVKRKELFYRSVPGRDNCFIEAVPLPPHPIQSQEIIIEEFMLVNNSLNISLSWRFPEATYGNITGSELIILRSDLNSSSRVPEDIDLIDEDTIVVRITIPDARTSFALTNEPIQSVGEDILCFDLLLRINNTALKSNWSDPVLITRHKNVTSECTLLPEQPGPTKRPPIRITNWWEYTVPIIIVVLLAIAVVITIASVLLIRNYRNKTEMKSLLHGSHIVISDNQSIKLPLKVLPQKAPLELFPDYKSDEWDIAVFDIILGEELGSGFFGTVYKGTVQKDAENSSHVEKIVVAVKMLKSRASYDKKKSFLDEISLMKRISSSGGSPHVVQMVGCVTITEPFCLLTEFVEYGDLLNYLKYIRLMVRKSYSGTGGKESDSSSWTYAKWDTMESETTGESSTREASEPHHLQSDMLLLSVTPTPDSPYSRLGEVSAIDLITFGTQIASGMEYLASIKVIHRDLACRNILVGENKCLKITDFGMSRLVTEDDPVYIKTTSGHLPFRWMALECLQNMDVTMETDVWSFGVTMWEIASLGGYPYPTIANTLLRAHLEDGNRLEKPPNCSDEVYNAMMECWLEDPSKRPSFFDLREKFEKFESDKKKMPIKFPKKVEKDYYDMEEVAKRSEKKTKLKPQDKFPPQTRYSYHHENDELTGGGLRLGNDIRKFLSEPSLDQRSRLSFTTPRSEGNSREKSPTNSYVDFPESPVPPSNSKHTDSSGKSMGHAIILEVPQVLVSAAKEI